jgi:hypothetical protein
MAVNTWLNSPSAPLKGEIDILQNMIDENIAAVGVDFSYLKKEELDTSDIFGESVSNIFKKGFLIEMYIQDVTNFNGDGDLFGKFGITATDSMTLVVSQRRFAEEGKAYNIKMPQEGDLLYLPMSNSMWEIKKTKNDEAYYQYGKNYSYRVSVSLYNPSHEEFEDSEFSSLDFKETSDISDDGLLKILGIDKNSNQDESVDMTDIINKSATDDTFDVNNPFGGR